MESVYGLVQKYSSKKSVTIIEIIGTKFIFLTRGESFLKMHRIEMNSLEFSHQVITTGLVEHS